jgi:hypothetical protein
MVPFRVEKDLMKNQLRNQKIRPIKNKTRKFLKALFLV